MSMSSRFPCGCEILVCRVGGVLRHKFTSKCGRHFGKIRDFTCENERMELVLQARAEEEKTRD